MNDNSGKCLLLKYFDMTSCFHLQIIQIPLDALMPGRWQPVDTLQDADSSAVKARFEDIRRFLDKDRVMTPSVRNLLNSAVVDGF